MSSDPTPQKHPPGMASPFCVCSVDSVVSPPTDTSIPGSRRTSPNRKESEYHMVPVCAGDATSLTASSNVHQVPWESCSWKSQSPVRNFRLCRSGEALRAYFSSKFLADLDSARLWGPV